MQKIHFISGLPRSGSTLLSALLTQNPRFFAEMSSPVSSLVNDLLVSMSAKNKYAVVMNDAQKEKIFRGIFESYYSFVENKEVVFDTRRSWTRNLPLLAKLFPDFKMICCVRSVSRIANSFETLITNNPFELSGLFGFQPTKNLFDRFDFMMRPDGHIGGPLNSLMQAINGPYANKIILVRYESLVADPIAVLNRIYDFIDEPKFPHDEKRVEYKTPEYDALVGTPGLHHVREQVADVDKPNILPMQLIKRLESYNFWLSKENNPLGVTIL